MTAPISPIPPTDGDPLKIAAQVVACTRGLTTGSARWHVLYERALAELRKAHALGQAAGLEALQEKLNGLVDTSIIETDFGRGAAESIESVHRLIDRMRATLGERQS